MPSAVREPIGWFMLSIPSALSDAVALELAGVSGRELAGAAAELSACYRSGARPRQAMRWSRLHWSAYAAVRMPATYAVSVRVLCELRDRMPAIAGIATHTDLFSGPGTAAWAVSTVFPQVTASRLHECEQGFIGLGERLMGTAAGDAPRGVSWHRAELPTPGALPEADLVTLFYGVGELPGGARAAVVSQAWAAARRAIAIVEAGTPTGFGTVLGCRRQLVALGAHVLAPCPHEAECPLDGGPKWCHFAQRLPRSREHRMAKGAGLGYEDEKYAYLIATRDAAAPCVARVIGHPRPGKAGITLDLCMRDGCAVCLVSKRDREAHRRARCIDWGDAWE